MARQILGAALCAAMTSALAQQGQSQSEGQREAAEEQPAADPLSWSLGDIMGSAEAETEFSAAVGKSLEGFDYDSARRQLQDSAGWDAELRELLPEPPATCDDARAENIGSSGACEYDCDSLTAQYFSDSTRASRCFIFDPVAQEWPASLTSLRRDRFDWLTYASSSSLGAEPLAFAVGGPRVCTNVTIKTSLLGAATGGDADAASTEVRCLFDGQHEYNHTVDQSHSVEVVGYAESGVRHSAGSTTDFVVGECTDVLVRVTMNTAGASPITLRLNDNHMDGPWDLVVPAGESLFEHVICFFDNDYTLALADDAGGWSGTVDVVAYVDDHTIYVPNDEDWVIQGGYADGLPALLDARIQSGMLESPTRSSIVLRHMRFSNELATMVPSVLGIMYSTPVSPTCHGKFCAARFGGAFMYW